MQSKDVNFHIFCVPSSKWPNLTRSAHILCGVLFHTTTRVCDKVGSNLCKYTIYMYLMYIVHVNINSLYLI